ncbi:MAG: signal peptidase II [Isosphaeraceae bacterium]
MPHHRKFYRHPVDLAARVIAGPAEASASLTFPARVVDVSRAGAGLVCAVPPPVAFPVGQGLRLLLEDTWGGSCSVREWSGRVSHTLPGDGTRLGLVFESAGGPAELACLDDPDFPSTLGQETNENDRAVRLANPAGREWGPRLAASSALLGLAVDQASKAWAWSLSGEVCDVLPEILAVAPVANSGALANLAGRLPQTAPLCALAALGLAAIAHREAAGGAASDGPTRMRRRHLAALGGGLLVAGLLGNSVDRLALGYVRDFLVSSLAPSLTFNLADVFLVLGAMTAWASRDPNPGRPLQGRESSPRL